MTQDLWSGRYLTQTSYSCYVDSLVNQLNDFEVKNLIRLFLHFNAYEERNYCLKLKSDYTILIYCIFLWQTFKMFFPTLIFFLFFFFFAQKTPEKPI